MTDFTLDNIDRLQAQPLPTGAWRITFRSANAGMCHQLYVNGELADVTDSAQDRQFVVPPPAGPAEVVVAAVAPPQRLADFAHLLPAAQRRPAWVFEALVGQSSLAGASRLELLGDCADGRLRAVPLAMREARPAWQRRWAFGEDAFGAGAFGIDGSRGRGFGMLAMGSGPFGAGSPATVIRVALADCGVHTLVLRAVAADGLASEGAPIQFAASPPPAPANGLRAISYDAPSDTLTLQIL